MFRCSLIAAALLVAAGAAAQTPSPTPWKGENLQYFPKDITRERLVQRMREFSFALGVRCQYCHPGGDGVSFEGVSFSSDEKPAKTTARTMLRMLDSINNVSLAQVTTRAQPRVSVECGTCHRGLAVPKSLQTVLIETVDAQGAAAAVERYRTLRKDALLGRYNFGEWEVNEAARRLVEAGQHEAAIAILEANGEFYPASSDIDVMIGEIHRTRGDREKAIQRYRAALAKNPQHGMAKQRLADLEKSPQ